MSALITRLNAQDSQCTGKQPLGRTESLKWNISSQQDFFTEIKDEDKAAVKVSF